MMNRIALFVLAIIMCLSCFPEAHAVSLSKEERYHSALTELDKYLNDEEGVALEAVHNVFSDLGSYEFSTAFSIYTDILLQVENSSFTNTALWIRQIKRNSEFDAFLDESGYGTLNEFECYVSGREAEMKGDISAAISYYESSISFMDSMERIFTLEESALEQKYQEGMTMYAQGTSDGYTAAYAIFTELAEVNYKDSRQLAENLLGQFKNSSTITPTSTPAPKQEDPSNTVWPTITFQSHAVKLTANSERISARLGPDRQSVSVGGYKVAKTAKYTALFREGNYIYCDAVYAGVDRRCVYFGASYVTNNKMIETVQFEKIDAVLNQTVSPRLGPGDEYELYDKVVLEKGTSVGVCGQYSDWLFIEYEYAFKEGKTKYEGTGRGWVDCKVIDP